MAKELRIVVACGSGVATSTIAMEAIKEILANVQVKASISTCSLGEVESKQDMVDLVLTTTNYRKPLRVPYMSVFGIVSGVNRQKAESDLSQLLQKMANDN